MSLGEPDPEYRRLFEAGKKVMAVGANALRPGRPVRDVARIVAEEVQKTGFRTCLWCGHGMGIDPAELRQNSVITIHPHVMSPDGTRGLLIGDTFVVDAEGGRSLSRTRCELKLL